MRFTMNLKKYLILLFLIAISFSAHNYAMAYDADAVKKYNEGIDYSKEGNFQEAIVAFRKAATLDPSFTDAYYNLGSLYEYVGNQDKALEAFEEILKLNPSDSDAAYKAGFILYNKGSLSKAVTYLNMIPASSSKYFDAQVLKKKATVKIQEYQKKANTIKSANTQSATTSKVVIKGFQGPTGIAKDQKGNIYVANFTGNSIIQISPAGVRKVLFKGKPVSGPIGLAVDTNSNVYVANYLSNEVIKITPQGTASSVLRGINKPYYLFIDEAGMLYISEQGTNTVIKIKLI